MTSSISRTPARPRNAGFTLIELAIVLVIVGLLAGGVLIGQDLIRAAELQNVTTEFSRYQTAVKMFQDQYYALPGDFSDAESMWGSMTNCGAASPSGTGTQTCDGNGNGRLEHPTTGGQTGESFTFWQHLANAGFIEGGYTGFAGPSSTIDTITGENVPQSKFSNAGWTQMRWASFSSGVGYFWIDYGHALHIGSKNGIWETSYPEFTPIEAWNIDTKIDDGKPVRGKFVVRREAGGINTCTDDGAGAVPAANNLDAIYNLDLASKVCTPLFRHAY